MCSATASLLWMNAVDGYGDTLNRASCPGVPTIAFVSKHNPNHFHGPWNIPKQKNEGEEFGTIAEFGASFHPFAWKVPTPSIVLQQSTFISEVKTRVPNNSLPCSYLCPFAAGQRSA